jgi:hypothetical protein
MMVGRGACQNWPAVGQPLPWTPLHRRVGQTVTERIERLVERFIGTLGQAGTNGFPKQLLLFRPKDNGHWSPFSPLLPIVQPSTNIHHPHPKT